MKGKILAVAVLVMVGGILLLNGRQAQAGVAPVAAIDNVFAALNSGEVDSAAASFAEDAVAENLVRQARYNGLSEIRQMLGGMHKEGRQFDIVDVRMDGDTITAQVEVSDDGHVWGTETIKAVVKDGKLQSFTVTAFRLELWRIGK